MHQDKNEIFVTFLLKKLDDLLKQNRVNYNDFDIISQTRLSSCVLSYYERSQELKYDKQFIAILSYDFCLENQEVFEILLNALLAVPNIDRQKAQENAKEIINALFEEAERIRISQESSRVLGITSAAVLCDIVYKFLEDKEIFSSTQYLSDGDFEPEIEEKLSRQFERASKFIRCLMNLDLSIKLGNEAYDRIAAKTGSGLISRTMIPHQIERSFNELILNSSAYKYQLSLTTTELLTELNEVLYSNGFEVIPINSFPKLQQRI